MWTSKNRARYDRSKLRYPSDVTDEEWELIVPLIPPGKSGGGQTDGHHARGSERPYVRSVDRLSVADLATPKGIRVAIISPGISVRQGH